MDRVGAVAIGRNEGRRLEACLRSLASRVRQLVYVDSGSTDGSPERARALGAQVVELDMSIPFTAARARNAGWTALASDLEYVMFVDGDCEVVDGFIDEAARTLDARQDVAVVCGRRRERHPERSIYNLVCDIEWDTPVGEAEACGGDALMRLQAVRAVDGYDPELIHGCHNRTVVLVGSETFEREMEGPSDADADDNDNGSTAKSASISDSSVTCKTHSYYMPNPKRTQRNHT